KSGKYVELETPGGRKGDLCALGPFARFQQDQRIPQECHRESAAYRRVQSMSREANRFAGGEDAPGVVERKQLDLEQTRRPEDAVPRLDAADDLAGPDEAAIVIAAQRPESSQRDDRPLTRFHGLLHRERRGAAHVLAADPSCEHQPLEGVRIDVERGARAGIAAPAPNECLGEDAAMGIYLQIAQIEHDAYAPDRIGEGGDGIALIDADARKGAEGCPFERPANQQPQWAGDSALHREPRPASPPADAVEEGASHSHGAVAIERGGVALPVVAEALGAGPAARQTATPSVRVSGRLGI